MDILNDIKQTFRHGSALTRLIYINLGLFLVVKIIAVFFILFNHASPLAWWLSVPSDTTLLLSRFWTPVTYMFLHTGFLHLLFNVLGLYWFGKLFLYRFEGDKLVSVYLLGGLSGALFFLLGYNLFPALKESQGFLLGASGSIFAVITAIAVYDPQREIHLFFIGRFPMKYVALFYIILSIIGLSASNPGGNLAHLGGAAWGWLYIRRLQRGQDLGSGIAPLLGKIAAWFKPRERMKVTFRQEQPPPRNDYEYNRQQNAEQEEINRILEKIAQSGYDSLTKREKEILFKQRR